MSVMAIYNNTAFSHVLEREKTRFNLLYKRKAMLHHYAEFVDVGEIGLAERVCSATLGDYRDLEASGCLSSGSEGGSFFRGSDPRLKDIQLFPAF